MNTGYGSFLTKIIKKDNNTLIKYSISEYGKFRVLNEINFYKNIISTNINFPIPRINNIKINNDENSFEMEYLKTYITCEEYFNKKLNNQIEIEFIINKIINDLYNLHNNSIIVYKELYISNLKLESYQKIKSRLNEIQNIIDKYSFIKSVNNFIILDINTILLFIENYINNYTESYIKNNTEYIYYPVHGDMQLNNILINEKNNDIKYIDPRGFFGNTEFYGMKEYDYAKLYFGLGGYSYFDLKNVNELNINNTNIDIDIKKHKDYNFDNIDIINIFIMCIWLGNAHCFKNNEYKLIESYYYALYIASKFIKNTYIIN